MSCRWRTQRRARLALVSIGEIAREKRERRRATQKGERPSQNVASRQRDEKGEANSSERTKACCRFLISRCQHASWTFGGGAPPPPAASPVDVVGSFPALNSRSFRCHVKRSSEQRKLPNSHNSACHHCLETSLAAVQRLPTVSEHLSRAKVAATGARATRKRLRVNTSGCRNRTKMP